MRTIIVALLVVSMALAGCAGDKDATAPEPTSSVPDVVTETLNATVLVPSLTADLLNGTAPLPVNFTLDATNVTGNITWVLQDEVDGNLTEMANGTSLPATVPYVFNATGNHTILFTVVGNTTESVSINLTVLPGVAVPTGPTVATTTMILTGDFESGASDTFSHKVPVEGPIMAMTTYVTWDDGVVGNAPELSDIDLFIKDGSGKQVAALEGTGFEYVHLEDAAGLAAGTWTFDVLPYDIPEHTTYKLEVIFWHVAPQTEVFEGVATAGVNFLTSVGDGEMVHPFTISAAETVATRLAWNSVAYGDCASVSRRSNDWDLSATLNGAEVLSSGNFAACEFGFKHGEDLSGDWEFIAVPFAVVDSAYTMTVYYA